jgi:hypothetical protein
MRAAKFCAGIAGVIFLYLASMGPVARLADGQLVDGRLTRMLDTIYFPVIWACEHNEAAGNAVEGYCGLWKGPSDHE